MGAFLQFALFPGCWERMARQAVEAAVRSPQFSLNLEQNRYSASDEGT